MSERWGEIRSAQREGVGSLFCSAIAAHDEQSRARNRLRSSAPNNRHQVTSIAWQRDHAESTRELLTAAVLFYVKAREGKYRVPIYKANVRKSEVTEQKVFQIKISRY